MGQLITQRVGAHPQHEKPGPQGLQETLKGLCHEDQQKNWLMNMKKSSTVPLILSVAIIMHCSNGCRMHSTNELANNHEQALWLFKIYITIFYQDKEITKIIVTIKYLKKLEIRALTPLFI